MNALTRLPVLGASLVLASCATIARQSDVPGDISDDIDGIVTAVTLDPTTLSESNGASIEISITNATDREMDIRFPDRRQIGLLIRDAAGELVSLDARTIKVPTYLPLGMFETWRYTVDWDGLGELGGPRMALSPGRYQLQIGLRRAGALYVNRSDPVDFVVETAKE